MPRTTDWRSHHAVDALLELDRAGLAWEFLRRNPDYREDFRQTLRRIALSEISEEAAMTEFSRRWGVSFRPRSRLAGEREPDDLAARADTFDHRSCRDPRSKAAYPMTIWELPLRTMEASFPPSRCRLNCNMDIVD